MSKIVAIGCGWLAAVWAIGIAISIYGLILAFKVCWWIGLIALLIEPAPFIIGIVKLLGGPNLAQKVFELLQ